MIHETPRAMLHSISLPRYTSPSTTPTPTPAPTPFASRFRCLQVRLLYEKCGHIETLVIHELPCQKVYRSWLPETSPYVQVKACPNMSQHLDIKKASCAKCNVRAPVVKRGFFGWGKTSTASVDGDTKEKGEGGALPIQEIVRRRGEWLREMQRQEERRREGEDEIEKLKKIRDC